MRRRFALMMGLAMTAGLAGTGLVGFEGALAQGEDPAITQARAAGIVGEMFDGYLGYHGEPSIPLQKKVDDVNIKRRAIYTDIAARQQATVAEVAAARGCDQIARRVADGEWYRPTPQAWRRRGDGPMVMPGTCG